MGFWGYGIFENDYILDDGADLGETGQLEALIHTRIGDYRESYVGSYHFGGLLLSTFVGYSDIVIRKSEQHDLERLINGDKKIDSEIIDTLLTESTNQWLTACTISVDVRLKLMRLCIKDMDKIENDFSIINCCDDEYKEKIVQMNNKLKDFFKKSKQRALVISTDQMEYLKAISKKRGL